MSTTATCADGSGYQSLAPSRHIALVVSAALADGIAGL